MTISKRMCRACGILLALATAVVLCIAPVQTAKAEESAPTGMAVCTAKSYLKLRSGPSSSCRVLAKLPARTFVKVYAQSGKWYEVEYNGIRAWGSSSYLSFAPMPAVSLATEALSAQDSVREYTIYYQGDSRWKFSSSVRKKACVMTAYAIVVNNMGISATPRFIYESNGRRTPMNISKLTANFGVTPVCALDANSPYLSRFDGVSTIVADPAVNAAAAMREAIDRHPEGVICYFKRGSKAHAVVACYYDDDAIYFSDPGRKRTTLLPFADTWVCYHHRMTYAHLANIIALDTVAETMETPAPISAP
jgi:hypothetical protein